MKRYDMSKEKLSTWVIAVVLAFIAGMVWGVNIYLIIKN